jgi:hypothetical protein
MSITRTFSSFLKLSSAVTLLQYLWVLTEVTGNDAGDTPGNGYRDSRKIPVIWSDLKLEYAEKLE